jgi:lipopolysaccharide/colanic/teichoic acid biosynthesis glycosyltransferase
MERILAQFSFTELPQLWNVMRGEMTLVGPRPESPDRARHYSDWQRQRLSVTPGLTGLAQVLGLRDQHASEEKARFDLQYIYHWSPFLDLSLVLQTCWTLAIRFWSPAHLAINMPASESTAIPPSHHVSVFEAHYADRTHSGAD